MRLPHGHPVRVLLWDAAHGRAPTRSQLDRYLTDDDLPDGASLAQYRDAVTVAAVDCLTITQTGDHAAARRAAEDHIDQLAERMTDDERAVTETDPNPEPLEDIGARMFGL